MLKEIIKLIKESGDKVLEIYQKDFEKFEKEDKSPFTEADIASNKIILSGLKKYNWPVLSEETEDDLSRLKKEKLWIIDPLDGTSDFLNKTGDFSIMIGLVEKGEPILGVVYQPTENKIYFSQKNKGSYLKIGNKPEEKLETSQISNLIDARFVISRHHLDQETKDFLKNNNIKKAKQTGSIGVKVGLIAQGKAEGYITFSDRTSQWDTCAPEIILKEAGGEMTNLSGEKFVYNRKELRNLKGIVASNKKIHQEIIM